MKKLLILAGAGVHSKVVRAAKEMGVYTIVTDYLLDSPAKKIADESWMLDIMDVEGIVSKCRKVGVDGVLNFCIDPAQRPYLEICERLGLPCYGTREQFHNLTDKNAFKKMCIENKVSVIPSYSYNEIESNSVEYPVFVKPVDSRGSRGQSVCYCREEVEKAICFAKKESSNGEVIIEKYIDNAQEIQVTYFFIDGKPYLVRTCDSYCGSEEKHLEKVVACSVSPSRYTDLYLSTAHNKVLGMLRKIGIKNGPVFMQGFIDNGIFRFFDPGLRFPGVDYEKIYYTEFGVNLMKLAVELALKGNCEDCIIEDSFRLNGKRAAILFPTVSAGKIKEIRGEDKLKDLSGVASYSFRYRIGDCIDWSYNLNQRLAEIDIIENNTVSLKEKIRIIQEIVIPVDTNGNNMTYSHFDEKRIK